MKPTDLDTWISNLLDGSISDADFETLQNRLVSDDTAVATYLETIALETLLEEPTSTSSEKHAIPPQKRSPFSTIGFITSGLAIAAIVAIAAILTLTLFLRPSPQATLVAQTQNPTWRKGDTLPNKPFNIEAGSLTFTMPSGVDVMLHAPASCHITGPNQLSLATGKLSADVPPDATGFEVNTPNGTVVDHGTRIGVAVDADHTELHVVEGRAEIVLPADGSTPAVSAMVEFGQAMRIHAPDNAGYEPIDLRADAFFQTTETETPIFFGFETNHPPWTATTIDPIGADRGDVPATILTKGQGRFAVVTGQADLPSHPLRPGAFHRGPHFRPVTGESRILPLPFHYRDDISTIRLTSPAFTLHAAGGPITAHITGGRGRADAPPTHLDALHPLADNQGFMGLALRRLRDNRYLCSVRREPGNFYDWAKVTISRDTLQQAVQNDAPDEAYVLDLIDAYRNPYWGWIGLDDVTVPGRLSTF